MIKTVMTSWAQFRSKTVTVPWKVLPEGVDAVSFPELEPLVKLYGGVHEGRVRVGLDELYMALHKGEAIYLRSYIFDQAVRAPTPVSSVNLKDTWYALWWLTDPGCEFLGKFADNIFSPAYRARVLPARAAAVNYFCVLNDLVVTISPMIVQETLNRNAASLHNIFLSLPYPMAICPETTWTKFPNDPRYTARCMMTAQWEGCQNVVPTNNECMGDANLMPQFVLQLLLAAHRRSMTSDEDKTLLSRFNVRFQSVNLERLPEDQYYVLKAGERPYEYEPQPVSPGPGLAELESEDITVPSVPSSPPPADTTADRAVGPDEEMPTVVPEETSSLPMSCDGHAQGEAGVPRGTSLPVDGEGLTREGRCISESGRSGHSSSRSRSRSSRRSRTPHTPTPESAGSAKSGDVVHVGIRRHSGGAPPIKISGF